MSTIRKRNEELSKKKKLNLLVNKRELFALSIQLTLMYYTIEKFKGIPCFVR